MKIAYWKLLLGIAVFCSGCSEEWEEPNYSEVPAIQLRNVKWVRVNQGSGRSIDSLQIVIGWQDGGGDLGMNVGDMTSNPDFQYFHLVRDDQGQIQYFDSATDTFNCSEYWVANPDRKVEIDNEVIEDTVRIIRNKYAFNFRVAILYQKQGEFVEYDFLKESCSSPIAGIFPPIDSLAREKVTHDNGGPFVIYQESPWRGTISFTVYSYALSNLFSSNPFTKDTLKVRVEINDRALNDSNIVESEPFTIEETDW